MSHLDPEVLALAALGDAGGTDAHLAGCALCRSEVERFAAVVAIARDGEPAELVSPPPDLWNRIAASADVQPGAAAGSSLADGLAGLPEPAPRTAAPGEPGEAGRGMAPPRQRWWHRRPVVAGLCAAAAGLIIGAAATAGIHQLTEPPGSHVVAHIALRPLPEFPQWRGASGTAVMRSGPGGRELAVTLDAPERRGFYEVWLLARNGVSMISLGDLNGAHAGRFEMPPGVNLGNYSRIDVSLQPFNGSTQHAKTSVVRGSLSSGAPGA